MRKLIMTALTAAFVLALAVGSASASNGIEVSPTTSSAETNALTFTSPEVEAPVVCPVTLAMTLHRTISKTTGSLAGFVTASVNEAACSGGRARALGERWHVQYVSFAGTLPNISSVRLRLVGASFLINGFGGFAQCLYRGNAEGTTVQTGTTVTGVRADEEVEVPLSRRLFGICPGQGVFRGTLTASTNVELRLI